MKTAEGSNGAMKTSRACNGCEKGASIIEFGLIVIPLLGFIFLMMDVAWIIFARSTLQHAAREGVRYAITGQTETGKGQLQSIQDAVNRSSFGFLTPNSCNQFASWTDPISIQFFSPTDLQTPLGGTGSNAGGNVVQVSINGVKFCSVPLIVSAPSITLSATSSDVMETSPVGGPPPL